MWDESGYIVTNNHVIEGASEATVRLNDGRTFTAYRVGSSPAHDLAVLRVNVRFDRPPAVPIGSSHDLQVGQKVFAIGNPFGLDYTLTSGLISALDRSLSDESGIAIEGLIQTDAAINPGNSGGPLLDSAGRLIGINTAIYSPSGAYAGIGFAVPVDTVNRVVPQLIARGQYTRPAIGISVDSDLNRIVQQEFGVEGVVVLKTSPGSSAEAAGLLETKVSSDGEVIPGDIIIAVDTVPVDSVSKLLSTLERFQVGSQVSLRIWRSGREMLIPVTLQAGT